MTGALTGSYCEWLHSDSTTNSTLDSEVRHAKCHTRNIRRKLATNRIRRQLSFLSLASLEVEEKIHLDYSHCECLEISLQWFLPLLWINSSKSWSSGSLGHNERKNKSWKIKGLRRSLGRASIGFKWEWRKSLCVFFSWQKTEAEKQRTQFTI